MKRFLSLCSFFALVLFAFVLNAGPKVVYPDGFPEELKSLKLRDSEYVEVAKGVKYYHFHFDNMFQNSKKKYYNVSKILVRVNTKELLKPGQKLTPEITEQATQIAEKRIAEAYKKAKHAKTAKEFIEVAKEFSDEASAKAKKPYIGFRHMFYEGGTQDVELQEEVLKLKDVGDISKPVFFKDAFYIMRVDKITTQMPVSVYYLIIDWNDASVKLKLAQCGDKLKTVKQMVEPFNPLGAVNGAYFNFKPPKTYYPLKIDGKMFEAKGYDSRTGLCWRDGEFPILDEEKNYDKYDNVIVGYHIFHEGKYTLNPKETDEEGIASGGTPLTSVGLNYETKRLVLLTTDGRFPKDAPGISFYGEGYFLKAVGCKEVLSIDGGGSCTMLIREKGKLSDPKNHPWDNLKFDHEGARSVQNCIYLIEK